MAAMASSSLLNTRGVEEKDFDLAIQTIYRAFSDENGIVKGADLEAPAPVEPALAALHK